MEEIKPPRWSWVHWWEANRDPYLAAPRQGESGQADERSAQAARQKAVTALVAAVKAQHPGLRAAATAALGRIGEPQATDALIDRARNDEDPGVRRTATLALGLMDTPEAESALLDKKAFGPQYRQWALAALGLMSRGGLESTVRLEQEAQQADPATAHIASWGLTRRQSPNATQTKRALVNKSRSPWVASDMILAIGREARPESIPFLADILLARPGARWVKAYASLEDIHRQIMADFRAYLDLQAQHEAQRKKQAQALEDWKRRNPDQPPPQPLTQPPPAPVAQRKHISGVEWTYASELRGSAAIALGMIDHPEARRALLEALRLPDDYYSDLYKGPALMSLGRIADGDCLLVLISFLEPPEPSNEQLNSPLRGYAALALGLYARPIQAEQESVDRPKVPEAADALIRRLLDRNETLEVRTACAVAIGLTQRTEYVKPLQALGSALAPTDELLLGYSLLARGMLADGTMIEPARKLLLETRDRTDMNGILARRAAVLGLGLLDRQEVVPILRAAWHLNHYVNREVILALALSGASGIGSMLVDLLEASTDPEEQSYFARCLGELFNRSQPGRLAWFLNESNYMLKNEVLLPFQSIANEFLFNYLIAAFGDEWR